MPTTTNFGWTTPADTDLVKDGASAMRTLGNGIDTSLVYLKGGTTGQILSKTSNTDLAFTWINNDQGDLTAITAGTGISVTSGTGPIPTVAIDTATTVDKTTAQTLTNKTLTAPIISTISNTGTLTLPTSTDTLVGRATTDTLTNKTISGSSNTISNVSLTTGVTGTLPTANGGTNLTTYTTGDLPYASASNILSKLAIGTTGQVLTVSGGVPTWAAGGAGALTLVKTDSFSAATAVAVDSVFTSTYTNYRLLIDFDQGSAYETNFRWRASGSDKTASNYKLSLVRTNSSNAVVGDGVTIAYVPLVYQGSTGQKMVAMDIFAPQPSGRKTSIIQFGYAPSTPSIAMNGSMYDVAESHDGFKIYVDGGTITGNYWLYGYQKS